MRLAQISQDPSVRRVLEWRVWRAIVPARHPLLLAFVLVQTWLYRTATDWDLLTGGARALTTPHALGLYTTHPHLQVGPPGLAVVRLYTLLPDEGLLAAHLSLAVLGWYLIWQVERWAHPTGVDTAAGLSTLVFGLSALGVWSFLSGGYPHVEDGLVILAFAWAAPSVRNRRWLTAALLVGLAMAVKPWAVVLGPLLWGLPRRGRALMVAALVPVLCWLPFLLARPHTMHAVSSGFPVQANSTMTLLGFATGDPVPVWWRSLQLLVMLVGAAVVAWRRDWCLAAAAGCTVRLLVEPAGLDYYVAGLVLVALLTERLRGLVPWRSAVLAVGLLYTKLMLADAQIVPFRVVVLVGVLVSWWCVGRVRSEATGQPPVEEDVPVATVLPVPGQRSAGQTSEHDHRHQGTSTPRRSG